MRIGTFFPGLLKANYNQFGPMIKKLPENQRFMKGLFAWAGYKTTTVEYKREVRIAGKSSFNGWKLWNFALDGITGFSTVPLRLWSFLFLLFCMEVLSLLKL